MTSSIHHGDMRSRVRVKSPYKFSNHRAGYVVLERRSLHWQFLPLALGAVVYALVSLGWEVTIVVCGIGAFIGWVALSTQPFKIHAQAGSVILFFKLFGLTRKRTIASDSLECFRAKPYSQKTLNGTELHFARVDLVLVDGALRKLYEVPTSTHSEAEKDSDSLATALAEAVGISVEVQIP